MLVSGKILIGLICAVLICCSALNQAHASSAQASPEKALSAGSVIQKAVERASNHPQDAGASYTYTKVNVTEQYDTKGKVKERKARTFQVYFRAGTSYVKLLEVDGHAPAQADVQFQAETQSSIHQFFGQPSSGGDNRESFLTPELAARFDYKLLSQCSFNGRQTYQIHFQPKNTA